MGAIPWFIAAIVLAGAEMLAMDFSLLMLGLAAAAAGGVALADVPLWGEIATFVVVALTGLVVLRPALKKKFGVQPAGELAPSQSLKGRSAEVVEAFGSQPAAGEEAAAPTTGIIRVDGHLWSARAAHVGDVFAIGETVQIVEIDGNTALVWRGI